MSIVDDEELMAYLDGELPPERAAWLARQIAASPELRAREKDMQSLLGVCTQAFAIVPPGDPWFAPPDTSRAPFMPAAARPVFDVATPTRPAPVGVPPLALVPGGRDDVPGSRARTRARPDAWTSPWLRLAAAILLVAGVTSLVVLGRPSGPSPEQVLATANPAVRVTPRVAGPVTTPRAPTPGSAAAAVRGGATRAPRAGGAAPRVTNESPPDLTAEPRPAAGTYAVDVTSSAVRVVAAVDGSGDVGGTKTLATGDGTRFELDYGPRAVQQGGTEVTVRPGEEPAPARGGGSDVRSPSGVPGLDAGRVAPSRGPTGAPACAEAIRWRDAATGVELRLRGPVSCERLRALASQLTVVTVPR